MHGRSRPTRLYSTESRTVTSLVRCLLAPVQLFTARTWTRHRLICRSSRQQNNWSKQDKSWQINGYSVTTVGVLCVGGVGQCAVIFNEIQNRVSSVVRCLLAPVQLFTAHTWTRPRLICRRTRKGDTWGKHERVGQSTAIQSRQLVFCAWEVSAHIRRV